MLSLVRLFVYSVSVLFMACSNRYITRSSLPINQTPAYEFNYLPETASLGCEKSNLQCIRYVADCVGSSPSFLVAKWAPGRTASLDIYLVNPGEYVPSLISYYDDNRPMVRWVSKPLGIHHCSVETNDAAILRSLNLVWTNLEHYTYFCEESVDGCALYIETADTNGLQRRLRLSTPTKPYNGSDISSILGLLLELVAKEEITESTYRKFFGHRYTQEGNELYISASEIRDYLQEATSTTVANERVVTAYVPPPCQDPNNLTDSIADSQPGCFIIKQPSDKKTWK